MIDLGGAANANVGIDLTETTGLDFSAGVSYAENAGNASSIAVYECR